MKSKKFKRIVSFAVSVAMTSTFLPNLPALAEDNNEPYPYTMFASSSAEGAITINTGNFNVNGNIATNGTIVANGNMNINGTTTEHADESMLYVLKKLDYTYFSGENVATYTENYALEELNININNPIDVDGTIDLNGSINLNSGIKAIDDITINGEVKNSNNAVICSETGDINIETSNVSFNGLIYAPYGDIVIDTDNLNLNNVVIIGQTITIDCPNVNANYGSSMANFIGNESDIDIELYAMGKYNTDVNAIDIEWFTNYTNSNYEVLYSDDNENYISVATVSGATMYQYLITEEFQKRYFKISLTTNYGEVVESIPFIVTKNETGYGAEFLDSDEDGLPDIYEVTLGTDINISDTDNDGLTDYQEVYITYTDPIVFDSVTSGVSDANADSDEDGISNIQEILLGTDTLKVDTDKDGLNDYDEVNLYNTSPTNSDTDNDYLSDFDELALGLNPLNPDTDNDGVLDGDEYIEQEVNADRFDSAIFNDNIALPSLTISAKGNVNNNLDVVEYTDYLKGEERVYVGKVIEIKNSEINSGLLSFTLNEDYTVKNYKIGDITTNGLLICYNDGDNTIPLETSYDVETRTLSAEINSSGVYFILDVMSWLDSYDIEINTDKAIKNNSVRHAPMSKSSSTSVSSVSIKGQVDIVFVIDTTGSMQSYITNVKNNINAFVDEIENAGISPSFALVDYKDITADGQHSTNTKTNNNGGNWFKDADEFKDIISKLNVNGGGDGPETAIDALEMAHQLDLRTSSQKFFILVTDADYKIANNYGITSINELIKMLSSDKINVSVVSNSNYVELYRPLYDGTGGIFANVSGNFKNELLSIADMINEETNSGCWIALNGLVPQIVKLDERPTTGGTADTDKDSIIDIDELMSIEPEKVTDINVFLHLLGLPFDYRYTTIPYYNYYSNPAKADTDNDGLDDLFDNEPKNKDIHAFVIYETDPGEEDFHLQNTYAGNDSRRNEDFRYADLTKSELCDMPHIYWGDFLNRDYFSNWKRLTKLCSMGEMEDVAIEMMEHFVDGTGSDYHNDILSKNVDEHENTKTYTEAIDAVFKSILSESNGDLYLLKYNKLVRNESLMVEKMKEEIESGNSDLYSPNYDDKFGGLGITVDGLAGNRIEVSSFKIEGNHYSGTLHYTMYDIYGLDSSDITDAYALFFDFGILNGFRHWYILQHWDEFDGDNKPFISYMEFDRNFEGYIS